MSPDIFVICAVRLEGNGRERWGGVWEAPRHYTLNSSHSDQADVTLQVQFDADSWSSVPSHLAIRNIVPWINRHGFKGGKPILSTAEESDVYWYGTVVTATDDPAGVSPWIERHQARTGARLYWLRED